MKKTSTLQQKLKSYSSVAGAVAATAVATDANAQVVYTDVSPDVTVNTGGTKYDLDLDNNATVDFSLAMMTGTYSGFAYNYLFAYTLAGTTNQIDTLATAGYSVSHAFNDNISSANLWNIGAGAYHQHLIGLSLPALSANIGDWQGDVDGYLAVKFDIAGATHYGWARLDVAADASSMTIKDYAYNSTANTPILAGDMGVTGIANVQLTDVKVFSTEKQININMGTIPAATVIVRDMTGREVYTSQLNASMNQIDMSAVTNGIYTVAITTPEGRNFTKKVSIR